MTKQAKPAPARPTAAAETAVRAGTIRRSIAKQLSRDRVLAAAARVFGEADVEVSVEDILRAASLSRRTFYKMFTNKEQVLAALYETVSRLMVEAARTALERAPTAQAAVDQCIDMFLGLAESDGALMRVLEAESMRPGSTAAALREANLSLLCELIVTRMRRELGRQFDPMLARGVLHALEGISLSVRRPTVETRTELRRRARQAARQISYAAFGLDGAAPNTRLASREK